MTDGFTDASYRPFNRQRVYFDRFLNHERSQMPHIFPARDVTNIGFYVTGVGSDKPFSVLATDLIPDLAFWGSSNGQFFPRYTYAEHERGMLELSEGEEVAFTRVDNITDAALDSYRSTYGEEISKDDIFYYIYGLLHSPEYRVEFAADLRKMLPRIPMVTTAEDFRTFATAGQELVTLHVGYEGVEPYPLTIAERPGAALTEAELFNYYRIEKMRFGGRGSKDRSVVIYNSRIVVSGIPDEAHEYLLGSRSGIEWVIERYQVKTDRASGIVNDPNDWSRKIHDPSYILDLLARVITVSVETVRIVRSLPSLSGGDPHGGGSQRSLLVSVSVPVRIVPVTNQTTTTPVTEHGRTSWTAILRVAFADASVPWSQAHGGL
jgi:predicted helicase